MTIASKSEVKELSPVERELSIVVPSEALKSEVDRAYQRLSQKVRLKGFRQGKVPRQVLEQYYRSDIEREVLDRLLGTSYRDAIVTHSLEPIAEPAIEASSEFALGKDFSYKARVEIKPRVELKKWQGLAFSVPTFSLGDEEVNQELEALRESQSTIEPVNDRETIQQNDLVECSYSGKVEEHHAKALSALNQTIEVGSGKFFSEVEQALVGKKIGDKIDVNVHLPDTFSEEKFRGKDAHIAVSIQGIKAKKMPTLDNEFAKDVSEQFETLEDLKAAILASLNSQKTRREEDEKRNAALMALIENNPIEVPQSMVDRQAEYSASRVLAQMPPQQAKEIWQKLGRQLKEEAAPNAIKTVKASLLCEALAHEQNIVISDDEIERVLEEEAQRTGAPKSRVRANYKPDDIAQLKFTLANEKALSLVIEHANMQTIERPFRS